MPKQSSDYPDYVLKRSRLSKTKTVVVFRRNNLNAESFEKVESGYFYHETFQHKGYKCLLELEVKGNDLSQVFSIDTKTVKVKGWLKNFGIFLRFPDQERPPLKQRGEIDCLSYSLVVLGSRSFYLDDPKAIRAKKRGKVTGLIHNTSVKTPGHIPSSAVWNMTHPFQGGGVSPK